MRAFLLSAAALLFLSSVGILESSSQAVQFENGAATGTKSSIEGSDAVQTEQGHYPDALLESPVENEDAKKQTLPRMFGSKTFLLGLIVFLAMLYASVHVDGEPLQKRIDEILGKDNEENVDYLEQAKRLGAHLINPFQGNSTAMSLLYTGSFVYMLSGFSEMMFSLMRRSQARRGMKVSRRPPMRAVTLLTLSVLALLVCFAGIFFTPYMHFLTIGYLVAGFVFGASTLTSLSFIQRNLYERRKEREAAAKAAIPSK